MYNRLHLLNICRLRLCQVKTSWSQGQSGNNSSAATSSIIYGNAKWYKRSNHFLLIMNRKLTTKTMLVFLPCSSIRQLDCRGVGLQKESNQCICSRPNWTEQREQMGRAYGRSYEAPWSTEELCHCFLRRVARRCMELALGFHRPLPAPRAVHTKVVHTKILPHFKYPNRLTTPGSCRPDNGILSLFFCKTFNGVCHEATVDIVSCIFHRTYFNSGRSIYPYFSTPNLFFFRTVCSKFKLPRGDKYSMTFSI